MSSPAFAQGSGFRSKTEKPRKVPRTSTILLVSGQIQRPFSSTPLFVLPVWRNLKTGQLLQLQYGQRDIQAYLRSTRSSSLAVIQKGAVTRRFLMKRILINRRKKHETPCRPYHACTVEVCWMRTTLQQSFQLLQTKRSYATKYSSHKKKAPAATLRSRGIQFDWGQFGGDGNGNRRSPRSTSWHW